MMCAYGMLVRPQRALGPCFKACLSCHCAPNSVSLVCSYVLPEACISPRMVCVAFLGLHALCIGRLVPALAALSVPVDVTHLVALQLHHARCGNRLCVACACLYLGSRTVHQEGQGLGVRVIGSSNVRCICKYVIKIFVLCILLRLPTFSVEKYQACSS